jgi:dTDP-4-amino-4,6-dideoxygalactose transaminase
VFADIDPATYNVSADTLAGALEANDNVKAIIPVHLFGQACDPNVETLSRDAGAHIVHDAAQAIGSRFSDGAKMGSRETTCFSFFPAKNLGAYGDGGMLTTTDEEVAGRLKSLRAHGAATKYFHDEVGMNSRLDSLQAAILRVKLPHLDRWNGARATNAAHYDELFASAGASTSATPLSAGGVPVRTPEPPDAGARHVYNQYVIRVPADRRDPLREHLSEAGIGNAVYYPLPLHVQPCFAELGYQEGDLPESEAASKETLAIPVYPELRDDQQARVVETVVAFLSR